MSDLLVPNDWQQLEPLVDAVLEAPPERRAELLAELSGGNAARRAELERLVAECERGHPLLDRPAAERFAGLFDDDAVRVPESLAERYPVTRELGRGGMATVYLARDLRHGRDVAVKIVRPELAAALGRQRFLREIAVAAQLHHPHIVPLYDSGEADGFLYYVMPYEEGPSLRARLGQEGALPVGEAMSILRDVARALAYAHEHGVVHRDIKPDNVLLSGGSAMVTDFGIAKALTAASADASRAGLTQTGLGIGTPAYMAPEQVTGDPGTDHRADIYSFGCLAYELFTGKPPFHGLPTHQVAAAQLGTTPIPVTELRADAPEVVARLITRCLEKDPALRPQSARELLLAIDGVATLPNVTVRRRSPVAALAAAGLAAVVLAGAIWLVSRARARQATGAAQPISLAVLPFANVGGDSAQEYLADGLSDEIATAMGSVFGVHLMSRSGARQFGGRRDLDLRRVGDSLGARYLVTGDVRQARDSLSVRAQLTSAADRVELWSAQFDRRPDDLAAIRDEIVRAISDTLRARFPGSLGRKAVWASSRGAASPEAYDLYIRGNYLLKRRGPGVQQSVANFQAAIAIDSTFAPAYAGLSMALELLPYFEGTRPVEVYARANDAAIRALRLDSTLAQAHTALGLAYFHATQWNRAEAEFRKAIDLDPRDADARLHYGRFLQHRYRVAEALAQLDQAKSLEPLSAVTSSWVAYSLFENGRHDEALKEIERAIQLDSTNLTTVNWGSLLYLEAGRPADARRLVSNLSPRLLSNASYVYAVTGDSAAALRIIRDIEARRPEPWLRDLVSAGVMLALGDTTRALARLERAARTEGMLFVYLPVGHRVYDPIRKSARFSALVRGAGLDERLLTVPRTRPTP